MRKNLSRITLTGSGKIWTDFLKCFGMLKPYPRRVLAMGKVVTAPYTGCEENAYAILAVKVLEDGPARISLTEPIGEHSQGFRGNLMKTTRNRPVTRVHCPTLNRAESDISLPKGFRASAPIYDTDDTFEITWNDVVPNRPKRKKANTHNKASAGLLEF